MILNFSKPNVVRLSDKILLLYCQLHHLSLRTIMRIVFGKQRRDDWFKKRNRGWMNPITGKKLLIRNEQGFRFWIRANTEDAAIVSTKFERDVLEVFKPSHDDVVLDVGANVGKYVIHTANLVSVKGMVVALEPFDETFNILCENIKENGFEKIVKPIKIAASDKKRKTRMYFKKNWWGLNSIVETPGENYVEVNTDTIDSLLTDLNIEKVNWVKIDVEGAEYDVLLGAVKTLTNNNINLIIEVRSANKDKVSNFLKSLGYSVSILESYNLDDEKLSFYNLFAKKSN
jgi:FkbM family methyltransferase